MGSPDLCTELLNCHCLKVRIDPYRNDGYNPRSCNNEVLSRFLLQKATWDEQILMLLWILGEGFDACPSIHSANADFKHRWQRLLVIDSRIINCNLLV